MIWQNSQHTSTIRPYILIINNQQIRNQPQAIWAQQNTNHISTNNQKHYRNNKHQDQHNQAFAAMSLNVHAQTKYTCLKNNVIFTFWYYTAVSVFM